MMFYLNKGLESIVNRFHARSGDARHADAPEGFEIGFEVDSFESGNKVDQSIGLVTKSVMKQGNDYAYVVASGMRPMTVQEEKLAERAKGVVIDSLSKSDDNINMGLFGKAREIAGISLSESMSKERADYISYLIAHDTVGYGPISMLIEDREHIEEIEINSPNTPINIFHVSYGRCRTNLKFRNEKRFRHALNKLIYETDKELGEGSPIIDAQVEGARIHAQMKPYATSGAIEEDINELKAKIDINNSVALCGSRYGKSVSTREQVINALRMRPDRLVVGEVRGEETRELFSGANLGIPFITTMHSASGGSDILKKLVVRPMCVEAKSLSMLDIAVYMRHLDASRRLLSDIYEYRWLSRAETEKLGIEIEGGDSVDILGVVSQGRVDYRTLAGSKVIGAFSKKKGVSGKAAMKELARRAEFLKVTCESSKGADEVLGRIQSYGL